MNHEIELWYCNFLKRQVYVNDKTSDSYLLENHSIIVTNIGLLLVYGEKFDAYFDRFNDINAVLQNVKARSAYDCDSFIRRKNAFLDGSIGIRNPRASEQMH
jgi:hypothetical protein